MEEMRNIFKRKKSETRQQDVQMSHTYENMADRDCTIFRVLLAELESIPVLTQWVSTGELLISVNITSTMGKKADTGGTQELEVKAL